MDGPTKHGNKHNFRVKMAFPLSISTLNFDHWYAYRKKSVYMMRIYMLKALTSDKNIPRHETHVKNADESEAGRHCLRWASMASDVVKK